MTCQLLSNVVPAVNGFLNLLSSITLPSLSQTLNLLTVHRHSLRATPSHTRRRSVFVVASPSLIVPRSIFVVVPRRSLASSSSSSRLIFVVASPSSSSRLRLRRCVSVLHRSSSLSVHRSPFARVFIVPQSGKSGLVALNLDIAQVADFVKARLGASESGCIEIEENWDKVKTIFLPTEKPMTLQLIATLSSEQDSDVMKAKPRKVNEAVVTGWLFFRYLVIGGTLRLLANPKTLLQLRNIKRERGRSPENIKREGVRSSGHDNVLKGWGGAYVSLSISNHSSLATKMHTCH